MSKPIPVMDTKPTYDIDEVEAYFTEGIKIHTWGATIATHENKDTTEPTCKVPSGPCWGAPTAQDRHTAFSLHSALQHLKERAS